MAVDQTAEIDAEKAGDIKEVYLLVMEKRYNSEGELGISFIYEYDINGYLVKESEVYDSGDVSWWLEYENDEEGRRIKETRYDENGAGIFREYEYDEHGNMSRKLEFEKDGSAVGNG